MVHRGYVVTDTGQIDDRNGIGRRGFIGAIKQA
jgi:hypothetical protein